MLCNVVVRLIMYKGEQEGPSKLGMSFLQLHYFPKTEIESLNKINVQALNV
jgi:hypothetical protein